MNRLAARSYDLLWLSLALLFLLPVAFYLSVTPHDYWWYVRIGQDVLQTGSIPVMDTFSYTHAGRPIFYQPWLSAVIFWSVHSLGGAPLTFLLKGLSIGAAYAMIWMLVRELGSGPRTATLLVILMGLSSSMNWSMRPQILAYPLFAAVLWILWRWQRGDPRSLWGIPILCLLWANLHGSFILAFILMASALLFGTGDRKQLLIWSGLALLGTFVNPRGALVWQFVSDMLRSPSDQLFATEWRPPINAGWQMNIFFGWLLLFVPLAVSSPRRLSRLEWIWFLGFGWLALTGLRYVIWFMFIMTVLSGGLLTELLRPYTRQGENRSSNPVFNFVLGGVLLFLPLMMLPGLRESWWADAPPAYHEATTPIAATDWLRAHPDLEGPLFAEYTFSSYLTFALPSRLVWIDNRFNAYPPEHWEKYQSISSAASGWDDLLAQDRVNLLMLSRHTQPALIEAVGNSGAWCEQYRDEDVVIFTRCEPLR